MTVTHENHRATLIDILDRILDKGIVIDAWVRVSLVGVDLVTVEARIVLASLETYLTHASTLALSRLVAAPAVNGQGDGDLVPPRRRRTTKAML
ncbi:MAG TPA: gas vesicle protein GvpJ [Terriglobales bacterium]|nr:gas vesicle protein GvpJ [Terriglobales bacterium]